MTSLDDFTLTRSFPDIEGLYDRFGNRYVFTSHRDYECQRDLQIIAWLNGRGLLYFL